MSTLGKIVYLSEAQASELFANGSITVDGNTITYSADDLYLTPENIEYVKKSGDTMTGTLATPRLNIVSNSIPVLWYMSDDTTDAGQVGLRLSDKRYFIGYRNNANKNIYFSLPPLSSDNTSESTWYDIVTTKGDYTMTGTLTAAAPITSYHSTTPSFAYKTAASGSLIAESAARAGTRQIFFREYASDTAYHEDYLLPEHSTGATGNATYNIVTTKGSYTLSGRLIAPGYTTKSTNGYPNIYFQNNGTDTGYITHETATRRFIFSEYPTDSSSYYEAFMVPAPSTGLTANQYYTILTNKSPVTVAQGGTGATTQAGAMAVMGAYCNSSNAQTFTFENLSLLSNTGKFKYGLLYGGEGEDKCFLYFIFLTVDNRVWLYPIYKGSQAKTFTASVSGTTLTLTGSATIYGGVRLIWINY